MDGCLGRFFLSGRRRGVSAFESEGFAELKGLDRMLAFWVQGLRNFWRCCTGDTECLEMESWREPSGKEHWRMGHIRRCSDSVVQKLVAFTTPLLYL